jgi:hypothetical protein
MLSRPLWRDITPGASGWRLQRKAANRNLKAAPNETAPFSNLLIRCSSRSFGMKFARSGRQA